MSEQENSRAKRDPAADALAAMGANNAPAKPPQDQQSRPAPQPDSAPPPVEPERAEEAAKKAVQLEEATPVADDKAESPDAPPPPGPEDREPADLPTFPTLPAAPDALAAMADGEDLWPESKVKRPVSLVGQPDSLEAPRPVSPAQSEARRKRQAALRNRTRDARAHQFSHVMIPMLVVTAGLLILLATVAVVMRPNSLLARGWAKYLVYAAFPMAVILLAGAGLFWQEERRSRKRSRGHN